MKRSPVDRKVLSLKAERAARRIYAEAHDRHAELQMVQMFAGLTDEAKQHGIAADIARRAWAAEWSQG